MGNVLTMDERKSEMCSIRLTPVQKTFITEMKKIIQKDRGPGAKTVTQTECILILLSMGIERFTDEHKKANPKRKKEVS